MRARIAALAAACVLMVAASAAADTIGPADEPHFEEVARRTLGLGDEPILLSGRADWLFGVDEFRWGRIATMLPDTGVLIVLDTQLVLAVWDAEREVYVPHLRIPYADMRDVRRRVWGLNQRFVVVTKRDTLHAFQYTAGSGVAVNLPRTTKALGILREKLGLAPVE